MLAINNSVVILGTRLSNKAYQEKGKYIMKTQQEMTNATSKREGVTFIAKNLYNFDSGTVNLDSAITICSFDRDSFVKVGESENGYVCWIETSNGDVTETPHIDDTGMLNMWLEGTELTKELFINLVAEYEIWD